MPPSPIRHLYFFRHGETDWNAEQRFQGHTDIPLNNKGREQARALVAPLQRADIQVIFSSDLARAVETAEIVARELKVAVLQNHGLREAHLGLAQGLTLDEIRARFGASVVRGWRSPFASDADVSYPGGESGRAVLNRVMRALYGFLHAPETADFERIGISTHGGVIRRVMHYLLPPKSPPVEIPNTVLYHLTYSVPAMPSALVNPDLALDPKPWAIVGRVE